MTTQPAIAIVPPTAPTTASDADVLRPVLDALPVLLLAFDVDGVCILAHGGLLTHLGSPDGGHVGRRLADFFAQFPETRDGGEQALSGETVVIRGAGDGSLSLDVQWHPRRDENGSVIGVSLFAAPATDVSEVSAAVRAGQEYQALLAAIPDQLFRLGTDGRAMLVKPPTDPTAAQLSVGWSPAPLVETSTPPIAAALSAAAAEALAAGSAQTLDRLVRHAGDERHVEMRLIPETDDHVLGIVRDVTEAKRAEVERRESSKLEALGRLSAGVAHEINTPIQFVSHNVEFMSDSFAAMHQLLLAYRQALHATDSLPWEDRSARLLDQEQLHDVEFLLSEVPQAVEDTLEGIRRVGTIVQALKQFSHPSARELQASDVNDALQNAVVVATNEHKHVAEVDLQLGELPLVVCDPGELTQVFLNLIVNAAHALEPLADERGRLGRIELGTRLDGDHVVVRVTDDGPGISYADQERIFDAFFTTKEVGKGTGQGLTLARSIIVDGHDGELTMHSIPGEGTTFEVRLPVAGPPLPARDVAAAAEEGA